MPAEATVGAEVERYLRVLQVRGLVPLHPWTVRGFTTSELERELRPDSAVPHPWQGRYDLRRAPRGDLVPEWILPEGRLIHHSSFPARTYDGPVWAGRGLTAAVGLGARIRFGRLHLRLAPRAFLARNRGFALAPNGRPPGQRFRDPRQAARIDRPQRFGDDAHGRLDAGESTLEIDLPGAVLGASTAAQQWGPALHEPLILGANAGGFPHLFLQTRAPLDAWLFRLHGRLVGGRLDQSEHSPIRSGELRRFASGTVLVLTPRGIDGLELGATRFVTSVWPDGGPAAGDLFRVYESIFENEADRAGREGPGDNGMASAFFRWTLPAGGLELYGEVSREDFAGSLRPLLLEPDDLSGRMLGLQKVWRPSPERLTALRVEVVNAETAHQERLDRGTYYTPPIYWHSRVRQGHTHNGQLLGSPAAYGGAGLIVGVDRYGPDGRWTVEFRRMLRQDWLPAGGEEAAPDVLYSVEAEALWFRDGWEVTAGLAPTVNLNRHTVPGNHAFDLAVTASVRGLP